MEQKQQIESPQESILQNAFNAAQTGVWHWDIDQDRIRINDAWARLIGYAPEELAPFDTAHWLNLCHPEDRKRVSDTLSRALKMKNKHFSFRTRLRHKNGDWIWGQFNGGVTEPDSINERPALSGTLTDVTELYHSKNNLRYRYEIEKLVSEITSNFVGIPFQDTDKTIDQALQKIGQFMNVDRCYVFQFRENGTLMNNTHEWHTKGIKPQMGHLQNLPSSIFPWWMNSLSKFEHLYIQRVKDLPTEAISEKEILQSQSIISLLVVPIHYQQKLLGFIGFDSVVREKEWLEADIHLMNTVAHAVASALNAKNFQEALVQAKEKAEESDQIKSAFLATINHELRTPLHHILGFSDLLRMRKIPVAEISNFADKIYKSGKNLLQIIEDILSLAQADESSVKVRKEYLLGKDLFIQHKSLLDEMLKSASKEQSLKLHYNPCPSFLNSYFISDNSKINQVIINLLKNAIKFTNSGSIEYRAEIKNKELSFHIKDTGIGITQDQQKLIFDFFRQVDDSSTRIYSGVGIGLAISKRITTILQGELTVCSIPGKGSTFTLKIPIETAVNLQKATRNL
ncbi:GAF domain-containing sensor histidine kinase [Sunxiuqinia rutila]|uniref:sensor histidine kinase n=1 Tax=Sunxiuqinia rutila TaxID=1397841 RepID=UPI003D366B94